MGRLNQRKTAVTKKFNSEPRTPSSKIPMSMSMSDTIGIANNRTAEATQHIMAASSAAAASSTTKSTNMAGGDVNTNTPGEERILGAFQ